MRVGLQSNRHMWTWQVPSMEGTWVVSVIVRMLARQPAMTDERRAFLKLDSVGDLIAARTLVLHQDNGANSEINVLLGKPRQLPDHQDYFCPYQIKGAGDEKVRYSCGVDSFQALHLALS